MKVTLLCIFISISLTVAQEIAYTSFEEPETLYPDSEYVDFGNPEEDHSLLNNDEQPLVNYQSIGYELGFQSFYYNTRGGVGLTDGDYVGVTNITNDVDSYPDGNQGFEISDADGYMVAMLDTIDISIYNSILITLDFFLVETGWESNDILRLWLVFDDTVEIDLLNTEGADIDNLSIEGRWNTLYQNVSGYQKLNVKFGLDCNAETEALYVDNIHIYENLPPIIEDYAISIQPPQNDESFSDTVRIYDIGGSITKATLHYSINLNDTVDVEMVALGFDSLYTAEIFNTAYMDEDQVDYWVSAMDDNSAVTISESHGFFAGITGISIFKQWYDNTDLLYENYYVRTSGVATVADSIFSKDHMNFYIQDDVPTAVKVFQYDAADINIIPGDLYTVVGVIKHNGGLVEVRPNNPAIDVIDEGEATLPEPISFDMVNLINGDDLLEGLLVRCAYVDRLDSEDNDPWPPAGTEDNADILISDDGGTSQLILHLDKDTNIPGKGEPNWPLLITGIFCQSDWSVPYTEGYQIIPRSINDIEVAGAINEPDNRAIPNELILFPAYPNPFNPTTTISFTIPVDMVGDQTKKLTIYNTLGQIVKEYILINLNVGMNTVIWNGLSNDGKSVTSGLYFTVLQINNVRQTTKLLLLK